MQQGQSAAPISVQYGRMLDAVSIEFPINNITTWLSNTASHRVKNTPKNLLMVSSILTVGSNTNYKEFPIGSHWFVEEFDIRRNVQRRIRIGKLALKRWYQDLPTA
jgi:hypothetical protein